jgi:NAD(P)-dependent dehydrogenase (short-subunit alcohol dehydrogenase family)
VTGPVAGAGGVEWTAGGARCEDAAMSSADVLPSFRLDDRVVVLTGASSGLGERFARVLDAAGARLVLAARRVERLEGLASELRDAAPVRADLTVPGEAASLVEAALGRFGRIDVVVNNAGISRVLPAIDDDADEFRRELEIDLVAPYELARLTARHLIAERRSGSIINVGSVLGHVGGGRLRVPGYAAAKGGLHNLTRELASQWARRGVRVNAIAPGWFETEMNTGMFDNDAGMSYIVDGTPMGRAGREGELDGALLFLAGDASSYVTGHVLFVDGGWTAI